MGCLCLVICNKCMKRPWEGGGVWEDSFACTVCPCRLGEHLEGYWLNQNLRSKCVCVSLCVYKYVWWKDATMNYALWLLWERKSTPCICWSSHSLCLSLSPSYCSLSRQAMRCPFPWPHNIHLYQVSLQTCPIILSTMLLFKPMPGEAIVPSCLYFLQKSRDVMPEYFKAFSGSFHNF